MAQFVNAEDVGEFITVIAGERELYVNELIAEQLHLVHVEHWNVKTHTLGAYRPVEPLKGLFFHPRDNLGTWPKPTVRDPLPERIVIGVKNCDLASLKIHDHVFLKTDPPDPVYAEAREKTILVACDCIDCREVCFCPVVGEQPHAKDGYDLNLSPLSQGLLVETGSERGVDLLREARRILHSAPEAMVAERDRQRQGMYQRVAAQAAQAGLQPNSDFRDAVEKSFETEIWQRFAEDCVECGACNFCCCTCHCFLLGDGQREGTPARTRQWDSCLYRNFAEVAGGGNPRKHRADRLHNRFDKKFNFFPQVLGIIACDGCGRCTEACTGDIDIREILKELSE
jgi:hypothetical protein